MAKTKSEATAEATGQAAQINLNGVKVKGEATVLHKPNAIRLDAFPKLVYAPRQYGDGIWLEDGKASVRDVAEKAATTPNYLAIAQHFGTSEDHVADAIRYASDPAIGYLGRD